MTNAIEFSARHCLRLLLFVSLFTAPVGALAFNGAANSSISKQGAGLVLYVTLQRHSMN